MYRKNCSLRLRTLSGEYDSLIAFQHRQGSVHIVTGKLGKMSKGNMRQLETIKRQNYLEKNSPFVAYFGCNR